jgi:hypothetical protein
MAYKLGIQDKKLGISANVRYENLARLDKPEVKAIAPNGKEVAQHTVVNNQVIQKGQSNRCWVDDTGQQYSETELKFYVNGEQVERISQTKVLEILEYQPETNYTDMYVIDTYYELYPDDNSMKSDYDREKAVGYNLSAMHKLWEYLHDNKLVARGEFNAASKGFMSSDGYIRAIFIEGKWGLEIGKFKEKKVFEHLNEGKPADIAKPVAVAAKTKKIKFV